MNDSDATAATSPGPDPRQGAGEVLVVGVPGTDLDPASEGLLREVRPGGVILFAHNVEAEDQLRELVAAIRRAVPEALLFCDAEGGRVDRLAGLVGPAPAASALAGADPELARRAGRAVGDSLRLFGFDADFAPVVDLDHAEHGNALDGRYLGGRPEEVIPRARAFLEGLHQAGVAGCLKHFPGLGPSRGDTHFEAGLVEAGADALGPDLEPFAALGGLAGAVMVAHAVYPGLDPDGRPASVSPAVAGRLLRQRLGFTGVAVADDLEMQALDPWGDLPDRAAAALQAGCDLLPVCHNLEAVPEIAERLAHPDLATPLAEARERLAAYRDHIRTLREATDDTPEPSPDPQALEAVRTRLAEVHRAAEEGSRRA
ncbi:MAG: beta-N-acetylhexosaminidase [Thermoanaerobaculia bacterium]